MFGKKLNAECCDPLLNPVIARDWCRDESSTDRAELLQAAEGWESAEGVNRESALNHNVVGIQEDALLQT